MSRAFSGWTEQAFELLLRLEGMPSQEAREKRRKDRERLVRQPMIALLNDVADADGAYEDFSVWGFRKDPWWWQHQAAVIRIARNVEIGLRFDLDGLRIRGGWSYPDPGQVPLFRAAVAAQGSGPELVRAIGTLEERGYEITGDTMKRVPRGHDAGHPRADLLRYRSVRAARPLGGDCAQDTSALVGAVLEAAKELEPLLSWLAGHVSVPGSARRGV
ncbi:DUF2461 family protein [Streptomyces sp. NBC_01217]|uniref:DUF2461 family protein n=1 Tax=Streptomyces sp. NBC_01217 TaxID=2903779 RepID=UPI002E0D8FD3|nr:DUF2461 domain-containing protein [Streptomyces sp. NBC_01217]